MEAQEFQAVLESLTRRQQEVLARLLRGEHDGDIARALFIEPSTVRKHVEAICKTFGLKNKPGERYSQREALLQTIFQHRTDLGSGDILASLRQTEKSPKATPVTPDSHCVAFDAAWVGRDEVLESLRVRLSSCRLLMLAGITGIGKTALAERLCLERLQTRQDETIAFVRKNFDHKLGSLDFAEVAAAWLEDWGERPSPEMRKHPPYLLKKVVEILCHQPSLVLLDSLEALLLGDEETGWSIFADPLWEEFFGTVLSAENCQSQLIVTTQDIPASLIERGGRYPNFWHCQPLMGLTADEQETLFGNIGIPLTIPSKVLLNRIGRAYGGHPLALRTIAGEVAQDFQGDLSAYWQHHGAEIEVVEAALAEAADGNVASGTDTWALDRYSMALRRQVKSRLEQTFKRLAENASCAYLLLCTASVYRCPVKQSWWLRHLEHRGATEEERQAALIALRERYLVEWAIDPTQGVLVGQHNLVRSVALRHREHLSGEAFNKEVVP